jgi:hypothetical protein
MIIKQIKILIVHREKYNSPTLGNPSVPLLINIISFLILYKLKHKLIERANRFSIVRKL